MMLLTKFY